MKRSLIISIVLTAGLAAGCNVLKFADDRDAELNDVHEAVLRFKSVRYPRYRKHPVFLSIHGKDPSQDFLERFDKSSLTIKKGSEAGDDGFWFSITSSEWKSGNEVVVATSYHCGRKCGGADRYVLVRKDGGWRVEEEIHEWVE